VITKKSDARAAKLKSRGLAIINLPMTKRNLRQQIIDRSLDLEPERQAYSLRAAAAFWATYCGESVPRQRTNSRAVRQMSIGSGTVRLLTRLALKLNHDEPGLKQRSPPAALITTPASPILARATPVLLSALAPLDAARHRQAHQHTEVKRSSSALP
jgi:hypothetical protein